MIRLAEDKNIPLSALSLPFHGYHEWCRAAFDAVQRINTATDHACEGWEKLGFVRKFWRADATSPLWHSENDFALLSDIDRAVMKAKFNSPAGAALTKIERAHRWEVFQQLQHELTRLPLYAIPEIVGPEFALRAGNGGEQLLTVKNGLLSFDCAEIDSDTIHFYARHQDDPAGHFIPNGEKFLCFVNPYLPTHLIACDEKLRVKAICPAYERAHDEASLKRNMGAQSAMEAAQRVRLNLRHDDAAKSLSQMKRQNSELLGGEAEPAAAIRGVPSDVADCTQELLERENAPGNQPTDDWS